MEASPISQHSLLLPVAVSELGAAFKKFQRTAFRLELLPAYNVPSESEAFADFLSGKEKPSGFNDGWNTILRESHDRNAQIHRVRLLEERTPYINFEIEWAYKTNSIHGEVIRKTTRQDVEKAAVTNGLLFLKDFWMFDETTVFVMNYDFFGRFCGIMAAPENLVPIFEGFSNAIRESSQELF